MLPVAPITSRGERASPAKRRAAFSAALGALSALLAGLPFQGFAHPLGDGNCGSRYDAWMAAEAERAQAIKWLENAMTRYQEARDGNNPLAMFVQGTAIFLKVAPLELADAHAASVYESFLNCDHF